MLFYKPDYKNGGLIVLEATEWRKVYNIFVIVGWKVIFQYGNLKEINFNLYEKQSKNECFFLREDKIFNNLNDICQLIKTDIDTFVTMAKDLKEDHKFLIKETEKDTKQILAECETEIKRCDKQIRDFSALDIEREFEKRGLII